MKDVKCADASGIGEIRKPGGEKMNTGAKVEREFHGKFRKNLRDVIIELLEQNAVTTYLGLREKLLKDLRVRDSGEVILRVINILRDDNQIKIGRIFNNYTKGGLDFELEIK